VNKYLLLFFLLFFITTLKLEAKLLEIPEFIKISADEFYYHVKEKKFTATGNVKIDAQNFYITGDYVLFSVSEEKIEAHGNIFYSDHSINFRAEELYINTREKTGLLKHGSIYIPQDNIIIQAEEIERISENTFIAKNASYTTCTCTGTPTWSITSGSFKVEVGKIAYAKNLFFRIKGTPVLYLPAGTFPAKTDRETGFLMPHLTYLGRDGFIFVLPFYIVLSRNSDLTLAPLYYSKRGAGGKLNFRYVNSPTEKGEITFDYLNEYLLTDGRQRWALSFLHKSFTPRIFNLIDVNLISDKDYFITFGEVLENQGLSYTESRIAITRYSKGSIITGEIDYFQDIVNAGGNTPVYHKLPQITYSLFQEKIPFVPGFFSLNVNITNFVFETSQFEYYRSFRSKSLTLTAEPRFEIPFQIGRFLEFLPYAGFKWKTIYVAGLEKELNPRFTPEAQINVNSNIFARFAGLRHVIRPGATFLYEGRTEFVQDIIQYESPEKKLVYFYLKNFIFKQGNTGGREILQLLLRQNYFLKANPEEENVYLDNSESGNMKYRNNFYSELLVKVIPDLYLRFRSSYDEVINKFSFYNLNLNFVSPWKTVLSADYKYTYLPTQNGEILAGIQQTIFNFRFSASERYSFETKNFVEGLYEIHYTSSCKCWYITLSFIDKPGTREDRIKVLFNLIGLGF